MTEESVKLLLLKRTPHSLPLITAEDGDGFMRCGVKSGKDIITGTDVEKVCRKDYKCPQ